MCYFYRSNDSTILPSYDYINLLTLMIYFFNLPFCVNIALMHIAVMHKIFFVEKYKENLFIHIFRGAIFELNTQQ